MTIGERFRKVRSEKDLTQEQFAEKLKCRRSDITDIERNKKKPRVEILENLYIVFGININWLLFNTGNKKIGGNKIDNMEILKDPPAHYGKDETIEELKQQIVNLEQDKKFLQDLNKDLMGIVKNKNPKQTSNAK